MAVNIWKSPEEEGGINLASERTSSRFGKNPSILAAWAAIVLSASVALSQFNNDANAQTAPATVEAEMPEAKVVKTAQVQTIKPTPTSFSTSESKNSSKLWIDYLELTWWNEKLAEIFASAEDTCISEYGEGKAAKYWPRVVSRVSKPGLEEFKWMPLSVFNKCMSNNDLILLAKLDKIQYPYLQSKWNLAKSEENLAKSEENLAKSEENLAKSEENLAKSEERLEKFEELAGSN